MKIDKCAQCGKDIAVDRYWSTTHGTKGGFPVSLFLHRDTCAAEWRLATGRITRPRRIGVTPEPRAEPRVEPRAAKVEPVPEPKRKAVPLPTKPVAVPPTRKQQFILF